MKKTLKYGKNHAIEILLLVFSCFFSFWIMFHTFGYKDGSMVIAGKAWSDFGSHIPLIRSFSFGWNFPVQYPIFPGHPIHYHFIFYALVGLLEKIGIRIDYALNIPSAFGFFALLAMLYFMAKKMFQSTSVGILTVFLFLFNGTFSFLYFLKAHPFSPNFFQEIIVNNTFPSFGPYGPGLASAFWNLNIYTNQRHLAAAFAFSLFILFTVLSFPSKTKKHKMRLSILLGIILGASYFFHIAVFLMTCISLLFLSILFSKIRAYGIIILFIAGLIFYPQYRYMNEGSQAFKTIFHPGYLVEQLSVTSFLNYWAINLGLHIVLMPIGFLLAPAKLKKIFLAFFTLFLIGNLFQFSTEIAANHKFFNYFMLIGEMFSAYALVRFWKKSFILKPIVIILFFFLILSGIIDFFPIINDGNILLEDYPKNENIQWIIKNSPPDSVFLNTSYLYTPESLAGRKIFLGWPYFAWSAGYNTSQRSEEIKNILSSTNKEKICNYLKSNNLSYITLTEATPDLPYDKLWFKNNFHPIYNSSVSNVTIYDKKTNCP